MKALRSSSRLSRWREWAAPLWVGCNFSAWMRLLIRNRFAVHHSRWHFAVLYTFLSMVNSCLGLWQKIVFGRRVAETVIPIRQSSLLGIGVPAPPCCMNCWSSMIATPVPPATNALRHTIFY